MKKYRQTKLLIIFTMIITLSILLFLSSHGTQFTWLFWAKNYNSNKSLFPLLAIAAGALGSVVSGLLMQYTTRNNLASPFTMGILPATTMAVVILQLLNIASLTYTFFIALAIALAIFCVVLFITQNDNKSEKIIVGLAIGMVIMGINHLLAINLPNGSLTFRWFSNGFQNFTLQRFRLLAPMIIIGTIIALFMSKETQAFYRSPTKAATLGVNTKTLVRYNFVIAAVISVSSVMLIGEIAFVGMAIPNLTRLLLKSDKFAANALLGFLVSVPLLYLSLIIANYYLYQFQLFATLVCSPLFIITIILRRKDD